MEHCRISPCFFKQMYHMWAGASRQRLGITLEIRMKNKHITQKRVKELFAYNSNTGILKNRVDRGTAKEGEIDGWVGVRGYLQAGVDGTEYPVHQLAFLYHHGYLPENQIGHRDRDKLNSRIENLRE